MDRTLCSRGSGRERIYARNGDAAHEGKDEHQEDVLREAHVVPLHRDLFAERLVKGEAHEDEKERLPSREEGQAHGPQGDETLGPAEGMESPAPVQLPKGDEVEEVEEGAHMGDGGKDIDLEDEIGDEGGDRRAQAPPGSGQSHPGVLDGVLEFLLDPDEGSDEGDEERRRGLDAVVFQGGHVAHFVDVDGKDETQGEGPSPAVPVNGEEEEHGKEGLDLEEAE